MMTSVAQLTGVSLTYSKVGALTDISVDIPAGGMVGLIGPDGVGKSSLLALIAGARQIQQGHIAVLGADMGIRHVREALLPRIAYMPQGLGRNLYPTLSVKENVDFFARLFGIGHRSRAKRINELLIATGLAPFHDRPAAKLSGGMKQKLGLCCALIHDPDLLILDEPTTGVDPLSRRQFWELIQRIRQRHPQMTVLVATAYMEEAEHFDWLLAMDAGKIIGCGSAHELKQQTHSATLEEAFIRLLPAERQQGHQTLVIPPKNPDHHQLAIEANHLTQRFGDFTAVNNVSFAIEKGEIFGFLGSNGCGKTTTMKMLTGLLPPTEGTAQLFGAPVDSNNLETRRQVGYMSQSFSLYGELTVLQNLQLHAQLFHLPETQIAGRVTELLSRFELTPYIDQPSAALPLGIRQRLSLAVAVVHEPKLLILDEPTSGVDPIARDQFWSLLVELSRQQGVTIFISTHFMNEAERCDRISLMHAGQVLASDTPEALRLRQQASTLEEAFIAYLEAATAENVIPSSIDVPPEANNEDQHNHQAQTRRQIFSLRRLLAYAYREALELKRDTIRLAFALLGSVLLMFVLGNGISMDVEDLRFAVLDQDQSPESRDYVQNIAGSRYFLQQQDIRSDKELEQRIRSGELSLALEIPSGFGRDLRLNRQPEIAAWVDGALPYRGEMTLGYVQGMHQQYLINRITEMTGTTPQLMPTEMATRYRYNQDFRSIYAMVPAVIPLLLIFIPAILMALGVVREKELGSITNLYVTPVTRLEFLLGKQLPYILLAMISYLLLVIQAVWMFGVPIKGSVLTLTLGALLYVMTTTGVGLVISTFTKTQIAALFGAALLTMLPTVQFSGLTTPVGSLSGFAYSLGKLSPATYFLIISRGVFTKALGLADLYEPLLKLALFIPVLTMVSLILLPKQER